MDERRAAMAWTRLAEGEDADAVRFVREYGYSGALDRVRVASATGADGPLKRWIMRYDESRWESDCRYVASFIMPGDAAWPNSLADLGDLQPLGLWVRGDPRVLSRPAVGIVGSRDASSYGLKIARDFSFELAASGITTVSGGALGIDAAAHRGALAADGYTVVVSACGVDRTYPKAHVDLFHEVLDSGGVICSESPPGSAPHRHRFLSRNRIIAALARATIVVEAPYRSGALSTAHHALGIGRHVGAVPGSITSPRSQGCHRLLREGGVCVTRVGEVLELLGFRDDTEQLPFESLDPICLRVRDALPLSRAVSASKIAVDSGLSIGQVLVGLGKLEQLGRVESKAGLWKLKLARR